ncbi:MAG: glutamine amidotransferase family protein [Pirellulaceae bacterium]|nr:glutamine amidotransferase family protein [Pirellulaceae bacterium]
MCGIVGLFLKNPSLQGQLGAYMSEMLITMSDRGPDSAGIAIYGQATTGTIKLTVQSAKPTSDFPKLRRELAALLSDKLEMEVNDTHAVLRVETSEVPRVQARIAEGFADLRIMSAGEAVEIYKEVGPPTEVVYRFGLGKMAGSHGIGHTRMATESLVTTRGAHPFSTGPDQCLVHNGSLSNHNNLRRQLQRAGIGFETENDTEVAAAYLSSRIDCGVSLDAALQGALEDLDGFYTFLVSTRSGFGVLRDPIACKPAVLAENDDYVAFGSEYRALVVLPDIEQATVWEPEPATVYFWEH